MATNAAAGASKEAVHKELLELKDADVARMVMGVAGEVCQSALGVTIRFDLQIADDKSKEPEKVLSALKRLTMVLSHVVERTGMTPEYIASMYGKTQPEGTKE